MKACARAQEEVVYFRTSNMPSAAAGVGAAARLRVGGAAGGGLGFTAATEALGASGVDPLIGD
jgi:hypothetical protein